MAVFIQHRNKKNNHSLFFFTVLVHTCRRNGKEAVYGNQSLSILPKEQRRLNKTVKQLQRLLAQRTKKPRYVGHDFTEQMLDQMHDEDGPQTGSGGTLLWTARLPRDRIGGSTYYIGKTGVMDDDNKEPIILDWRDRTNAFTILGDLAQGIHGSQGTSDWKLFQSLFPEGKTALFELTQSYRSTMEIIRFSNHIIDQASIGVSKAVPVFRSGEPVKLIRVFPGKRIPLISTWLNQMKQQKVKSLAVITRTEPDANQIHQELSQAGISTTLINAKRRSYMGRVSVLPVYLTKGLEFDAVLLVDVSERHYQKNDPDAKLLYVGCTRALHQLWMMAEDSLSPLIQGMDSTLYEEATL
ncbi:3'-5' exonuclease [Desmospora profundinema]|uniref:DNA helicase IV n=1 Tax=Desmospora profundinema TaxID=1571184 RepID=A0ABU1IPE8_9BACL|nr:3'-5' exonuclease [Desmospora profundinema]MDR6226662.1 DNA helicase IV [Desmospora profundinema]